MPRFVQCVGFEKVKTEARGGSGEREPVSPVICRSDSSIWRQRSNPTSSIGIDSGISEAARRWSGLVLPLIL